MSPIDEPGAPSGAARDLARRLLSEQAQARGSTRSEEESVDAAEQLCLGVTAGLSRWFGPFGSQALVSRALVTMQGQHPVLREVHVTGTACLSGLPDTARIHGAAATSDAVVAVMAELADLIGRLIGDDLAITLLTQSMTSSGRAADAPDSATTRNAPQTVTDQ